MTATFKEHIELDIYCSDDDLKIHGLTSKRSDDRYIILLNGCEDSVRRLATFIHEMIHIYNHDFEKTDVQEIEAETRKQIRDVLFILENE